MNSTDFYVDKTETFDCYMQICVIIILIIIIYFLGFHNK